MPSKKKTGKALKLDIETDPAAEQYHMDPLLLGTRERTCKKHYLGKKRGGGKENMRARDVRDVGFEYTGSAI